MTDNAVTITTLDELGLTNVHDADAWAGSRPLVANRKEGEQRGNGVPKIITPRGVVVNSMLRDREWELIDAAVLEAARYPLRAVNDVRSRGLVKNLGGLGTLVNTWYSQSEMAAAEVSMTGTSRSRDLPDIKPHGVPVPVIFKDFNLNLRELEASRRMGDGLDTTAAVEAARVVAEKMEDMLINGSTVTLNGLPLYGYTNHPKRNTDTATNYGGGDWGTIANVTKTVAGMINAAMLDRHYGPYVVYAAQTQYNQAALNFYDDGTAETAANRIMKLPGVQAFEMLPALDDGEILLVQMTREVVEWLQALDVQTREWTSGDGLMVNFKVLAVAAPAIKSRYDDKSGIVHATSA